jgi:hypothetical protein
MVHVDLRAGGDIVHAEGAQVAAGPRPFDRRTALGAALSLRTLMYFALIGLSSAGILLLTMGTYLFCTASHLGAAIAAGILDLACVWSLVRLFRRLLREIRGVPRP